jgi:streptomycin 6-kinase
VTADPTDYLARWDLTADGPPITTPTSLLLPVRRGDVPAMLKIAHEKEERRGGKLMAWWNGEGAARVLAEDDGVLLLERASGPRSLAAMARAGEDDEATRILCVTTRRLHEKRDVPPPDLVSLDEWFEPLLAGEQRAVVAEGRDVAAALLADPQEVVVLHGDIHHENVLDAGQRGWIAIDPKGLWGERTFDFVNILRDPDEAVALAPGRFARQVEVIARTAALDRTRLLQWTLAFASLSAVWILGDGDTPTLDLAVAELAAAALRA